MVYVHRGALLLHIQSWRRNELLFAPRGALAPPFRIRKVPGLSLAYTDLQPLFVMEEWPKEQLLWGISDGGYEEKLCRVTVTPDRGVGGGLWSSEW